MAFLSFGLNEILLFFISNELVLADIDDFGASLLLVEWTFLILTSSSVNTFFENRASVLLLLGDLFRVPLPAVVRRT